MRESISNVSPVARALADFPNTVENLLWTHRENAKGECMACGLAGTGAPYLKFPCGPYAIAAQAARVIEDRLRRPVALVRGGASPLGDVGRSGAVLNAVDAEGAGSGESQL